MAASREVGRVTVRVSPDTRRFSKDLETSLAGIERSLKVEIPTALDTDGMHRDARAAAADADRIGAQLGDGIAGGVERGMGDPIGAGLDDSGRRARPKATGKGTESGGAFADGFKRRVQAALRTLPDVKIDADTSDADLAVQTLRTNLAALGDKKIGVDIDAETARAELAAFRAELASVAQTASVDVRVNTAAAAAQLAAFEAELARLDKHVSVDVDTSRGRSALAGLTSDADRASTSMLSKFTTAASGVSNNVWVMAAAVGAALAALPAAGGLAATGIVALFGAGLAGLGIAAVAHTKKVEHAFSGLKDHVVGELRKMAQPFVPVLVQIAGIMRRTFDSLAPSIGAAFDVIAPALSRFATNVGTAFTNLGPAIKPLGQAFADLLDALGPMLPGLFEQISAALQQLAGTISAHPDLFAGMIAGLLQLIPIGLKFINWLANVFVWIGQHPKITQFALAFFSVANAVMMLLPIISQLPGKIAAVIGGIVTWVASLPGKAAAALASFGSTLGGLATSAWNTVKSRTTAGVNAVVSFVRGLPGKAAAALAALGSAIGGVASSAWNTVRSRTTAGVNAVVSFVRSLPGKARSAAASLVGNMGSLASSAFSRMRSAASSGISSVVGLARAIPGRIRSAVGNLGSILYSAGQSVIRGLINGIQSMISSVASTMSNIANTVRSYLPFSPAKAGPLRSHPPEESGRQIVRLLSGGLTSNRGVLDSAMRRVAGAMVPPSGMAALAGASGVSNGGGLVHIENFNAGGKSPRAISEDLLLLMGARG